MNQYEVFSHTFSTSQPLVGPVEAGLNAISFSYANNGLELMFIVFALFPPDMQEAFNSDNEQLIDYFKSVFMATSTPSNSSQIRKVGNKESIGEIVTTSIPAPSEVEIHLIEHSNKNKVGIGFKSFAELNNDDKNRIIEEILSGLVEL